MTATVIDLENGLGPFVAGLAWRYEELKPKGGRLKELANQAGQRWGVVRQTQEGAYQVGLCEPLEGVKKPGKLKSLADVVAESAVAPWRGVYDLGNGSYWYIAVAEGFAILNDGDCIVSGPEVARLRAEHDSYVEQWKEVEGDLSDLAALAEVGGGNKLQDFAPKIGDLFKVSRRAMFIGGGVGALALGAAGVGVFLAQQKRAEELAAAEAQRAAALALLRSKPAADAAKAPPPPWTTMPMPEAVFTACASAWSEQELSHKGWELTAWTCAANASGVNVSQEWNRDEGARAVDAPGLLDAGGSKASSSRVVPVQWALPASAASAPGAEVVQLLDVTSAMRRSLDLGQRYGAPITLVMPPVPAPPPPGSNVPPPPPWAALSTTYQLPFAPWLGFGLAFDDLPGMRVSSVKLDLGKGDWTIGAQVYASRGGMTQ